MLLPLTLYHFDALRHHHIIENTFMYALETALRAELHRRSLWPRRHTMCETVLSLKRFEERSAYTRP